MKSVSKEDLTFRELVESIVIAVVLVIIIRAFIFQLFFIPSLSMLPTLDKGDRILVTRFSYWLSEPERGDVIVFKYPKDPKKDYIKRVIGKPGERIQLKDNNLLINGKLIDEPYLPPLVFQDYGPIEVPANHYFVLGDNRNNSEDSRYWGFLPFDNIKGKAQFIYWPVKRIQMLD